MSWATVEQEGLQGASYTSKVLHLLGRLQGLNSRRLSGGRLIRKCLLMETDYTDDVKRHSTVV